jgi:Cu2+-exporting ATPase
MVDGERFVLGNAAMFAHEGIEVMQQLASQAALRAKEGLSPVHVARAGKHVSTILTGDPVRPDAAKALAALRAHGWQPRILSGDAPEVVRGVARAVGIDTSLCVGGALPQEKLAAVRELQHDARVSQVVMVGDGVNDAAALAAASVGVAVRGGAEASLAAADVSLAKEGLMPIVELVSGAEATMRTIRRTIWASLGYNVIAAGLSMAGLISPLLAAIIMPASSLTVLALAWGSRAFVPRESMQRVIYDKKQLDRRAPMPSEVNA